VYTSTREEELRPVPWSGVEKEAFLRSQFEAQDRWWHSNYDHTTWDVIEVDSRPAGRLYVSRWQKEIRIVDIALLPDFRGRGGGAGLAALSPVLGAARASASTGTQLKVGVLTPSGGDVPTMGANLLDGIRMGFDAAGRPVSIVAEDVPLGYQGAFTAATALLS